MEQLDLDLLYQTNKITYTKVELLNKNFKILDIIEGNLISDNLSIDAGSSIRRTYDITLHVNDSSWSVGADKKIWLDRYLRIYIGYYHVLSKQIKWYCQGTFVISKGSYSYDETTNELSLSCLDLMANLTGDVAGMIGSKLLIPNGNKIRDVLISCLQTAGITQYYVCDMNDRTIPYDIEKEPTDTWYDVISEIVNLYVGYEFMFDINGICTIQPTPLLMSEPVILDNNILYPLLIKVNDITVDFASVRNTVEVFGASIDTEWYSENIEVSENTFIAKVDGMTSLENFDLVAIKMPLNNPSDMKLQIKSSDDKFTSSALDVYDEEDKIETNKLISNEIYVFKYTKDKNRWVLQGQYQAYGKYTEMSLDNPFSIMKIAERKITMVFDEIPTSTLCYQRAKYECFKNTFLKDTVSCSMIRIPFLDVNQKIELKLPDRNLDQYIITKISVSDAGTMSVDMVRFSEEYPNMDDVYDFLREA